MDSMCETEGVWRLRAKKTQYLHPQEVMQSMLLFTYHSQCHPERNWGRGTEIREMSNYSGSTYQDYVNDLFY
jgi:hypothetical protein